MSDVRSPSRIAPPGSTRRGSRRRSPWLIIAAVIAAVALVLGVWTTTRHRRPDGVALRDVDGGPNYYGRFDHPLPTRSSYFPIAVWQAGIQSPQDVATDAAAGINTYVAPTDDSWPKEATAKQMPVLAGTSLRDRDEASAWTLSDEVDMWALAGAGTPTGSKEIGKACEGGSTESGKGCGYTVLSREVAALPADKRARWANFGKGVLFWATDTDAARFVNDYADIVSADAYWFTDADICQQFQGGKLLDPGAPRALSDQDCRRAQNYGRAVERVRSLVTAQGGKPVWAFVELGRPFWGEGLSAKPDQVRAAVWSSIIHGARGITYFNHNFGGECQTHNILREPCHAAMRDAVTKLDAQISSNAAVLNSPDVTGLVTADDTDVLAKVSGEDLVLFTIGTGRGAAAHELRLACRIGGTAEVLDEGRSVPVEGGVLRDTYDGEQPHLYRISGGATECGLA